LIPAARRTVSIDGHALRGRIPAGLIPAGCAIGAAALVWLLPDRLYFVGDFYLRETSSRTGHSIFRSLYPQGLPLDAWLHDVLIRACAARFGIDAHTAGRLLGAAEAAILGLL